MKRLKSAAAMAGLILLLLCLLLAGSIRLPGDSGAPPTVQTNVTKRDFVQAAAQVQAIPIYSHEIARPSEPYSVEYKGVTFVDGQVISAGELTFYCRCAKCNGAGHEGETADGTILDDNTPPVAGCNWLPLNSVVRVGDVEYRIADRGRKGGSLETVGRLDIYTNGTHQDAIYAGRVRGAEVVIVSIP